MCVRAHAHMHNNNTMCTGVCIVLVSCPVPLMHTRQRIWSKGILIIVLKVRILWSNQVAELWSHDYVRSMLMRVHLAYAHGTEVVVSFFYAHRNCQLLHSSRTC